MTCVEVRPLLDAHVDRELDLRADLDVAGHLKECPDCARTLENRVLLSKALRDEILRRPMPAAFARRLRGALQAEARPRGLARLLSRTSWTLASAGLAAAAILIAALAVSRLGGPARPPGAEEEIAEIAEIVASHIRSLQAAHLTDVTSTDQHTVKPWFQGRLDFSPAVVDLAGAGFPLVGARLDYLAGRPVAALVYRRNGHVVNVFEAPSSGNASPRVEVRQGYNVISWAEKGMAYRAVSDLNGAELRQLVERLRTTMPGGLTPGPAARESSGPGPPV